MTLRRIGDVPRPGMWVHEHKPRCLDYQHNPPLHACLEPGVYEHTCPTCGDKRTVVVPGETFTVNR